MVQFKIKNTFLNRDAIVIQKQNIVTIECCKVQKFDANIEFEFLYPTAFNSLPLGETLTPLVHSNIFASTNDNEH